MNRLKAFFLESYINQNLYTRKKASYTVEFLALVTVYTFVVYFLNQYSQGFKWIYFYEMLAWCCMLTVIFALVKMNKLEIGINVFLFIGIMKGIQVSNTILSLHNFIQMALVSLIIGAIHVKKYQLYIGLVMSYAVVVVSSIMNYNEAIYNTYQVTLTYRTSIVLGFLMYLITIRYLSGIVDKEINKSTRFDHAINTDNLTGLDNRNAFNKMISELVEEQQYILMILDLDYFKTVNDSYGHQVGDEILLQFGQVLKNNLRSTDHLYRIGGEEFCVILEQVTRNSGIQIAESLRKAVETTSFGVERPITVSIGVQSFTYTLHESFDQWFKEADRALYKAKENGRNQVVVSELSMV